MSKLTEDFTVRQAIWKCHHGRCFYTGEDLSINDFELDHIIPERLKEDPKKLKEVLDKVLSTNPNFEIDSIYNLVPCKKRVNNIKSGTVNIPLILVVLPKLQRIADNVQKEIEIYEKRMVDENNLIWAKKYIGSLPEKLDEVYDFLSGENNYFEEKRDIDPHTLSYLNSTENVRLDGFLPKYPRIHGSCLITFKSLRIRGCMITLSHFEIMNKLFVGLHTDPTLKLRGFIRNINNENNFMINLESSNFFLTENETRQLCQIVDDFADEYIRTLLEIEKYLELQSFTLSKNSGAYKLLRISRSLWKQIIDFTYEFEVGKGNSKWNIFYPNSNYVSVFSGANKDLNYGYHVMLYPEQVEIYSYNSFLKADQYLWITWKPLDFEDNSLSSFNCRDKWSALFTYKWLINDLIPYVIYYFSQEKPKVRRWNFIRKKMTYQEFLAKLKISDYISQPEIDVIYRIDQIYTLEELRNLSEDLQSFFHCLNKEFYIKCEEIRALYLALKLCLENTSQIDYHYIKGNLQFLKGDTRSKILDELVEYILKLKDQVINSFSIDLTMRCIVVLLRDSKKCSLNNQQVNLIAKYLEPLDKLRNTYILIKKYNNLGV